jgi:competence protein ComEC
LATKERKIQLHFLEVQGVGLEGSLWASTSDTRELLRGDTVRLKGEVDEGFGTFVGMMTRASIIEVVRPSPGDVGRVVRDWFAAAVRLGIPEPQASLGIGFLTGQKSALPPDLAEALQIAGLTHIVVASGYNLTILVRMARRLFVKASKYLSVVTASMMIAGFVCVTGLSPSMTRAGLVSGLSLLAWSYGRSCHPFVLLPLVAAVTVLWQPSYTWGDMGWQLSFAAFFGVMVVAPLLQAYFFGDTPPGALRQVLGETIAAHLVTIPIVVSAFGLISHVAIPANLLIVPLVPLAMLLTFIVGIVGVGLPFLAPIVGMPATWLLTYMTEVSSYLAELPWAQMEWQPPVWLRLLYVVGLGGACCMMWRATRVRLQEVNPVV